MSTPYRKGGKENFLEKIDFWKKYPSLLVGQALPCGFIPDELHLPQEKVQQLSADIISQSYFLLHANPSANLTMAEQLKKQGAHPCQIFILLEKVHGLIDGSKSNISSIFLSAQDSSEEFRTRLLQAIELSRSNILALESAHFVPPNQDPAFAQRALDRARLTHSLCVNLKMGPTQHSGCIRDALQFENSNSEQRWLKNSLLQPWPQDYPLAKVLVDISELALRNPQSASFRQGYRNASSQLAFKYRTDLKNAVETCFQHIWGEHLNVA